MNELCLLDVSLLTPLGATPAMVKTAIEAGLNSYQLCHLPGADDHSLQFSPVPEGALAVRTPALLPGLSPAQIRLLKLTSFALLDLKPRLPDIALPFFLAGPEPYYAGGGVNQAFINYLVKTTGLKLDYQKSRYVGRGRAGVFEALTAAFTCFENHDVDYVLVAGVDTFYDVRTLGLLEDSQRLASDKTADGFVPGEAAACLLLASPKSRTNRCKPMMTLHRPGLAYESGHILGDEPYTAETLSTAVTTSIVRVQAPVSRIFSAENGESHYTKEMSIAVLRNQKRLVNGCPIIRPAEFFGDVGAASVATAIAFASVDINQQTGPTLVTASSDGGLRGAIALSAI